MYHVNTSIGHCHSGCTPDSPTCSGHLCTVQFTPAANGKILTLFNIKNLEGAGERDYSELVLFTRDGVVVCEGNPNVATSCQDFQPALCDLADESLVVGSDRNTESPQVPKVERASAEFPEYSSVDLSGSLPGRPELRLVLPPEQRLLPADRLPRPLRPLPGLHVRPRPAPPCRLPVLRPADTPSQPSCFGFLSVELSNCVLRKSSLVKFLYF